MAKVQDGEEKKPRHEDSRSSDKATKIPFNLGGVLGGLGGLIEKLGELAEAGEKLSQSGEFQDAGGKIRGVYGINVKTALGDRGEQELKVEPFGNVRRRSAEGPSGEDIREPLVDLHEEDDYVLVLAEIPGVSKDHVTLDLAGDRLNLSARRGDTKYQKEIVLPECFSEERMTWECNNGILKVRFER
ncbi:MAG TPA: Hsp20/alpha crystallin family protein [Thermoguttaceae bacterium]|nr:Hsp20/alpha crystallin family protein [Thermoguttaceae bacterium]